MLVVFLAGLALGALGLVVARRLRQARAATPNVVVRVAEPIVSSWVVASDVLGATDSPAKGRHAPAGSAALASAAAPAIELEAVPSAYPPASAAPAGRPVTRAYAQFDS